MPGGAAVTGGGGGGNQGGGGTAPGGGGGGQKTGGAGPVGNGAAGQVRFTWTASAPSLLVSVAASSGTDPFGNTYSAGVTVYNTGTGQNANLNSGVLAVQTATTGPTSFGLNLIKFSTASGFDIADIQTGSTSNGSGLVLTGQGDTVGNPSASLTLTGKLTTGSVPSTIAAVADKFTIGNADGNTYQAGHLILAATAIPQTISATSAATITGCSANTGAIAYKIRAVVQFAGAGAVGTAQFQIGVSGTASVQWGNAVFHDAVTGTSGYVARPTALTPFGSPTLSANNWMMTLDGYVKFTTAGAVSLQAFEGTAGDAFTVKNAFLEVTPIY